ncbi:hypothetical protein STEG23_038350, partial [Scotinomys teguina]
MEPHQHPCPQKGLILVEDAETKTPGQVDADGGNDCEEKFVCERVRLLPTFVLGISAYLSLSIAQQERVPLFIHSSVWIPHWASKEEGLGALDACRRHPLVSIRIAPPLDYDGKRCYEVGVKPSPYTYLPDLHFGSRETKRLCYKLD